MILLFYNPHGTIGRAENRKTCMFGELRIGKEKEKPAEQQPKMEQDKPMTATSTLIRATCKGKQAKQG